MATKAAPAGTTSTSSSPLAHAPVANHASLSSNDEVHKEPGEVRKTKQQEAIDRLKQSGTASQIDLMTAAGSTFGLRDIYGGLNDIDGYYVSFPVYVVGILSYGAVGVAIGILTTSSETATVPVHAGEWAVAFLLALLGLLFSKEVHYRISRCNSKSSDPLDAGHNGEICGSAEDCTDYTEPLQDEAQTICSRGHSFDVVGRMRKMVMLIIVLVGVVFFGIAIDESTRISAKVDEATTEEEKKAAKEAADKITISPERGLVLSSIGFLSGFGFGWITS